jgi:hypothetical protein
MTVGIQETSEVLDFVTGLLADAAKAANDGDGLTTMEVIKLGITNAPAAVKAAVGASDVVAEVKDLDRAELEAIAEKALALSKAVMALFTKPEAA